MDGLYDVELIENISSSKEFNPYICPDCHQPTFIERRKEFQCWNHNCGFCYEFLGWTVDKYRAFKHNLLRAYK